MAKFKNIVWQEPNRVPVPPLHIASRGTRDSTITGVSWLNDRQLVANHRNGKRVALFDLDMGDTPVAIASLPNLTDAVDIKNIGADEWEVVTSDCWEASFTTLKLITGDQPKFQRLSTNWYNQRTFCHGATYDPAGNLWLSLSTGADPRIECVEFGKTWRLSAPWGCRNICFDKETGYAYAMATSNNPKKESYDNVSLSIWRLKDIGSNWEMINQVDNAHTDAGSVYRGRIWINDQHADRVLGIDLNSSRKPVILSGKAFSFPHGVSVSPSGFIAVTNYGSSSISVIDLNKCI